MEARTAQWSSDVVQWRWHGGVAQWSGDVTQWCWPVVLHRERNGGAVLDGGVVNSMKNGEDLATGKIIDSGKQRGGLYYIAPLQRESTACHTSRWSV
ncbi:hypothetical protein U1Q18_024655 [Sarracenia purpurea var. burkii]